MSPSIYQIACYLGGNTGKTQGSRRYQAGCPR
jgi:hypothetical protein